VKSLREFLQQPWLFRTAVTLCALVPLFLGSAWVWTFGFTSYRAHRAFIGLPLGLACVAFSVALLRMRRWAIILSVPLAALASLAFAVIAAISGLWSYCAPVLVGGFYSALVIHWLFSPTSRGQNS
jgi:hypothetical protein